IRDLIVTGVQTCALPISAEDVMRGSDLVGTLEVYCETAATQGTAARLGIHRNTVLYRLKLIEEVTAVDLNDGSSRLFLQLGLLRSEERRVGKECICGCVV